MHSTWWARGAIQILNQIRRRLTKHRFICRMFQVKQSEFFYRMTGKNSKCILIFINENQLVEACFLLMNSTKIKIKQLLLYQYSTLLNIMQRQRNIVFISFTLLNTTLQRIRPTNCNIIIKSTRVRPLASVPNIRSSGAVT